MDASGFVKSHSVLAVTGALYFLDNSVAGVCLRNFRNQETSGIVKLGFVTVY